MTAPGEPCRTCDGTGYVETAPPDSRVIHQEPCPDCAGPRPGPAPVPSPLVRALIQEYADLMARGGRDPNRMPDPEKLWYRRGGRDALRRVAERLGVSDLHEQAAELVARGAGEEGP